MVIKVFFSVLVLCTAAVVAVVLAIHFRVKRHLRQESPVSPAVGLDDLEEAESSTSPAVGPVGVTEPGEAELPPVIQGTASAGGPEHSAKQSS